eukprot:GHVQ01016898.1.p1 GENE.GHVQ01016898.1~~GHVQ01016898.1.p1  ORF type:complete len:488 (+),score=37.89 GHVQ01016898.1:4954-6417(+)
MVNTHRFETTEALGTHLFDVSGKFYSKLEDMSATLDSLEEKRTSEEGFRSFKLKYGLVPFSDQWAVHDSIRIRHGPSSWGYKTSSIEGHNMTLSQGSPVEGMRDGQGTFIMLKGHRFFDTVFSLDFFAKGSGTVGVIFRMQDFDNFMSFEMSQKDGTKRLVRVLDGLRTVVSEITDGGFLEGTWFHVRVEVTQSKIVVCFGKEGTKPAVVFKALEGNFLSGTVGLFMSNMRNGAVFDNIDVQAKPCVTMSSSNPPLAPRCSRFRDQYFGHFHSVYHQVDPVGHDSSTGVWEHRSDVGGRKKVLAQLNSIRNKDEMGSLAIVKGNRYCKDGFFSFDFLPQCPGGIVGSVFRYKGPQEYEILEVSATEMRLRSVVNGLSSTVARVHSGFDNDMWHSLLINFEGPSLVATLQPDGGSKVSLTAEDLFGSQSRDGRVGLSSFSCGGVAFDNVKVSPTDETLAADYNTGTAAQAPWCTCSVVLWSSTVIANF